MKHIAGNATQRNLSEACEALSAKMTTVWRYEVREVDIQGVLMCHW